MMSGPETISTLNDEVKDEEATIPLELQEIKDLKNLRSEEFTPLNIQELTGRIDGILWESVIKNAEAEPILGRFEELKGHIKYYFSDKASTEETISVLEHVSEFFRIGIGTNEKISDKIGIFLREESPKLLEGCEKRGTRYKYELFRTYCFVHLFLGW